ncbi:MAG: rod shape-determining protein MreD [Lachnospiraceae bacterium]|nr:rod shape-determining protein MreD [Lachnospiraceae bacterium]
MRKFRALLIIALMIIVSFILQTSLFRFLNIGGISPNLMIIVTVSLSIVYGDKKGTVIGFICGLLCDIFFSDYLGFYALVYCFTGYLSGKFERIIFPDSLKLPIAAIAGSNLLYGFFCYVFRFVINGRFFFGSFIWNYVLPEILYTTLIALIIYPLIIWIYKRYMRPIRESEKNFAKRKSTL